MGQIERESKEGTEVECVILMKQQRRKRLQMRSVCKIEKRYLNLFGQFESWFDLNCERKEGKSEERKDKRWREERDRPFTQRVV